MFDQTKQNIQKSLEEARNQIPRYNQAIYNYQEQVLNGAGFGGAVLLERHRLHAVLSRSGRRPVCHAADAGAEPANLLSQPVSPPGLRGAGLRR
jgi:hypothetical protein